MGTICTSPFKKEETRMSTIRFNAIVYQNKLREAGLDMKIAEIHAEEMQNLLNTDISTKQDLVHLEHKMIIKLGSLVVGCTFIISVMIAVLGFLIKQS